MAQNSWAISLSEFSKSDSWLKALQYEKTIFGYKSRIDASTFFLAPDGKTNPERELVATIEAFKSNQTFGKLKHKAHCTFTGRYKILKDAFKLPDYGPCTDYETWIKALNAKDISLIFASSYPNNPASIFGHTFLRINNKKNQDQGASDLLDYGLNYAATTGSDGGIEFAIFGVFGMYEGHYSLMPYYLKINEYNNYENRDIFEYNLDFNEKEIDRLLSLVWEMENVGYSDYYFFDENCSFQILALLEGAAPDNSFLNELPFYVSPIDTLKVLVEKNKAHFKKARPSLRTQMEQYLNELSPEEKNQLEMLLSGVDVKTNTKTLESAVHALKLKKYSAMGTLSESDETLYHKLLVKRSKEASGKVIEKKINYTPPHLAHKTKALKIMGGLKNKKQFHSLSFRMGWHDELNNDVGHIAFSKLDLLKMTFYYDEKNIKLQDFYLVDVFSIEPSNNKFTPAWLWKMGASRGFFHSEPLAPNLTLGAGMAFENFTKKLRSFFTISSDLSYQKSLEGQLHFKFIPELGFVYKKIINVKALLGYEYLMTNKERMIKYPYADIELAKELSSSLEVRSQIKTAVGANFNQFQLGLNFIF
ncbi:PF13387 domain protein [Bacteriovorax sp. BSW11_IV]|uniref:Lnb N-terminal periplasmic domain-containing protein n=1 Tax=Bacteriovorax sp. BSW11_IV TaxID=1353529 RepID=UPI00038A028F|nr:DUF4105 domain-containing protein [Bacteriovorax sp. BSW11_IV]EQC49081.1 PF13387 domain protein [Bacteriovorax sp. BSW11_IV]